MNEDIRSLVITDQTGKVIDLGKMNTKAYKKSLENSVLWVVHSETGRVLPYGEDAGISFIREESFGYTAGLKTGSATDPDETNIKNQYINKDNMSGGKENILPRLAKVIAGRHKEMPEGSYTTHLFSSGQEKIRKKLGEEAVEVILASEKKDVIYESADLIYHLLVLLESLDISLDDVFRELESRE